MIHSIYSMRMTSKLKGENIKNKTIINIVNCLPGLKLSECIIKKRELQTIHLKWEANNEITLKKLYIGLNVGKVKI